jgi:hypothetical protein
MVLAMFNAPSVSLDKSESYCGRFPYALQAGLGAIEGDEP